MRDLTVGLLTTTLSHRYWTNDFFLICPCTWNKKFLFIIPIYVFMNKNLELIRKMISWIYNCMHCFSTVAFSFSCHFSCTIDSFHFHAGLVLFKFVIMTLSISHAFEHFPWFGKTLLYILTGYCLLSHSVWSIWNFPFLKLSSLFYCFYHSYGFVRLCFFKS